MSRWGFDIDIFKHIKFYPLIYQQVTLISLFLVVQQLQGVTYPLPFKWMNENMNELRRAEERKEQALKSRMKATVCQYVV